LGGREGGGEGCELVIGRVLKHIRGERERKRGERREIGRDREIERKREREVRLLTGPWRSCVLKHIMGEGRGRALAGLKASRVFRRRFERFLQHCDYVCISPAFSVETQSMGVTVKEELTTREACCL
jgi:hypothetical protein